MAQMTTEAFRGRHNATAPLAYSWARGKIELSKFIDQWFRLRTDLVGIEEGPDVQREVRWRTVESLRCGREFALKVDRLVSFLKCSSCS